MESLDNARSSCRRRGPPRARSRSSSSRRDGTRRARRQPRPTPERLAGSDAVYDAAFRRAGLLRVLDLDQLFAAAETLGRQKPFPGKRLAVLTNGGGVGVLAVDRLIDLGGTLAGLSDTTMDAAERGLAGELVARKPHRHHRRCGCGALRYRARCAAWRRSRMTRSSSSTYRPRSPARRMRRRVVAESVKRNRAGRDAPQAGFRRMDRRGSRIRARISSRCASPISPPKPMPCSGFIQLVRYREAQNELMETPDSLPHDFVAGRRGGAGDRRRGDRRQAAMARSAGGECAAARLRHPSRAARPCQLARMKPSRRRARPLPMAARSRSRSCRPISCTSRISAASSSTSPTRAR